MSGAKVSPRGLRLVCTGVEAPAPDGSGTRLRSAGFGISRRGLRRADRRGQARRCGRCSEQLRADGGGLAKLADASTRSLAGAALISHAHHGDKLEIPKPAHVHALFGTALYPPGTGALECATGALAQEKSNPEGEVSTHHHRLLLRRLLRRRRPAMIRLQQKAGEVLFPAETFAQQAYWACLRDGERAFTADTRGGDHRRRFRRPQRGQETSIRA